MFCLKDPNDQYLKVLITVITLRISLNIIFVFFPATFLFDNLAIAFGMS